MKTFKLLSAMLVSLAVVACGGGGESTTTTPPPATTYTISGTVTGATSVLVSLSGASTATATTDASGSYSFAGLANGSYTVTPAKATFAFTPTSKVVSVSGANVPAINFVATTAATTYSISGTVSGAASSGVTIDLGAAGSVLTGAGGTYTISGLVAGDYTVTPSLSGFTFLPTSISITALAANSVANDFVATAIPVSYSISGNVSGTTGVTITVTGTANATATTDSSGNYTVSGLYDGSYTVTPSKTGYTFTPTSTAVPMSGADVPNTNFAGVANTAVLANVSGTVTGAWIEGVTITMSVGASGTSTTVGGNYGFTGLASGASYTFTPSLAGYTFTPSSQTVAIAAGSSAAVTVPTMVASSAIASYSISGVVSYPAGSKTGPIGIRVYSSNCLPPCGSVGGTVISAPGAYTVRGLQNGSYVVLAQMDTLGTGLANATNPTGNSSIATIVSANLPGVNVTIADPTPPAPVTPSLDGVFPGDGSAFVGYTPPMDAYGQEIATSYKIYWGTNPGASTGGGSATFAANGDNTDAYVLSGLTNGAVLYFKMTALVGATESAASAVTGPVTINATTGLNTVSGTVTTTGTATGPMLVGVYSDTTGVYFTRIASPSNSQGYSIAGVPAGSYTSFAVVDNNNNGLIDIGDITNVNGNAPTITAPTTTSNLILSSANTTALVQTQHQFDGVANNYSLIFKFIEGIKRPVAATVISGPNMSVPFDMGIDQSNDMWLWIGSLVPVVGDSYTFKVTYSDGTTQNLSASVTGVLNSFAQNLAATSSLTPTFSWAAPLSPPASYSYRLNLWGNGVSWSYPQNDSMPSSSTLSVLYNGSALTSGLTYTWQVTVIDKASGNKASITKAFTAP